MFVAVVATFLSGELPGGGVHYHLKMHIHCKSVYRHLASFSVGRTLEVALFLDIGDTISHLSAQVLAQTIHSTPFTP